MRKRILPCALFLLCRICAAQLYLRSAEDALKIARANDLEGALNLRGAQEGVRMAKMAVTPFLPQLDFTLADSASAERRTGDYKQKTVDFGITQKIFNGGKSLLEYKMQREKSVYDFYEAKEAQEKKAAEVTKAYYDALLARLKADVLAEAARNAEELLEIARLEKQVGFISDTDFLESQIRCKKMRAQATNALNAFHESSRALNVLMNLDFSQALIFGEALEDKACGPDVLCAQSLIERTDEITTLAKKNNVELKKARAGISWAKNQRSMQKRAFLPSVSVRAGASLNGRSWPLTEPSYSFKLILGFDNNPWLPTSVSRNSTVKDGGLVGVTDSISGKGTFDANYFGRLKMGKINLEKSKLEADKKKREIECKVFNIIRGLENLEKSAEVNYETLALKERKLALSKIQLEEGNITRSDYLDELNGLATEKINFLKAKIERDLLLKELETLASCKF